MVLVICHAPLPETQSARAGSRRAQFQLWIFSYTINGPPSKKWLSRLKMSPAGKSVPFVSSQTRPRSCLGLQHVGVHTADAAALDPKGARRAERQVQHASMHQWSAGVDRAHDRGG